MTIDSQTFTEIITTLEPFLTTQADQQTFIQGALYGSTLLTTIQSGGSSRVFTTQLVRRAIDYGTLQDNKPAVVTLLEHATTLVGTDKASTIEDLITRILSTPPTGVVTKPPTHVTPNPPSNDDLTDQTIMDYLLLERVGSGGFGEVYRAEHLPTKTIVAFKLALDSALVWPQFEQRFEREINIIKKFQHPHIVNYRDHGRHLHKPYLVLDWVDGGDLRHTLNLAFDGLEIEVVSTICEQISKALDYVHKQNVIHRDLKPENIMRGDADSFFLTDFGIAKPLGNYTQITDSGVGLGTLHYAAPEQLSTPHVTKLADIYSLGLIMYELLSGQYPFVDLSHRISTPLPSLSGIVSFDSTELDKVLATATSLNPAERQQNIAEFHRGFKRAIP